MELTIYADKVLEDLKVNDSVSCSGICLTVTNYLTQVLLFNLLKKQFIEQLQNFGM